MKMVKKNSYIYTAGLVAVFSFLISLKVFAASSVEVIGPTFSPQAVTAPLTTLNYQFTLKSSEAAIRTECKDNSPSAAISWTIGLLSALRPDMPNGIPVAGIGAGGSGPPGAIKASDFISTSNKTISGKFDEQAGADSSKSYLLSVYCGASAGGKRITQSQVVTLPVSGQSAGLVTIKFDATPKTLAPGTSGTFNFDITLNGKSTDIQKKCSGSQVIWRIYKFPAKFPDNFLDPTYQVPGGSGGVPFSNFNGQEQRIQFPLNNITSPGGGDFVFKTRVSCENGNELTKSEPVTVVSGGNTGGSGCGTPGQPACKPGETREYSFEITNPLKGGASDFSSLVKIIAQWIFNLAIPIAVAMIVYAGILFLTSGGDTSKVTKARQVLTYAVIGLAIILIGSGFVTLIQSILELGGTGQTQGPSEPGARYGPNLCNNGVCTNGVVGPCRNNSDCVEAPSAGAVGNKCSRDRNCSSGLKCKDTICQRATGNLVNEPCNSGSNCDIGLSCDKSGDAIQVIDGQTLGSCFKTSAGGGRIGDVCQKDKDCISGLKCNQICQRKDGNLNGEICLKTSNPSNCQSKACHTIGTEITGDCVEYKGT